MLPDAAELCHAHGLAQLHTGNTAVSYLQAKRRYYRIFACRAFARA